MRIVVEEDLSLEEIDKLLEVEVVVNLIVSMSINLVLR